MKRTVTVPRHERPRHAGNLKRPLFVVGLRPAHRRPLNGCEESAFQAFVRLFVRAAGKPVRSLNLRIEPGNGGREGENGSDWGVARRSRVDCGKESGSRPVFSDGGVGDDGIPDGVRTQADRPLGQDGPGRARDRNVSRSVPGGLA